MAPTFAPYARIADFRNLLRSGGPRRPGTQPGALPTDWATFDEAIEGAWRETALSVAVGAWTAAGGQPDDSLFEDAVLRISDCVVAAAGVCSVPARTLYCAIHGTAAIDVAVPELRRTLVEARAEVDRTQTQVETMLPSGLAASAQVFGMAGFLEVFDVLRSGLTEREDSLRDLERAGRALERASFGAPGGVLVPQEPGSGEALWAEKRVIKVTQRLATLVREAGFLLWVNAASNQYGGRHPPHQGHNKGIEVDLDWTRSLDPNDKVPNLARGDLVPVARADLSQGAPVTFFIDPVQGAMTLVPAPGNEGLPTTQRGVARLATWVVIQGAALLGFRPWIYIDRDNIKRSLEVHLFAALSKIMGPEEGKVATHWDPESQRTLSQLDAKSHYNHLHTENPPSDRPCLLDNAAVKAELRRLATIRDDDEHIELFLTEVLGPEGKNFREGWSNLKPRPLLPAWVPGAG
jgi:hypothetical protein